MIYHLVLLISAASIALVYSESFANSEILKHIGDRVNASADPCEDFYSYACGGFNSSSENKYTSAVNEIQKQVNDELISYAKTAADSDYPEFAKKAYEYYNSCVKNCCFVYFTDWMTKNENYTWGLYGTGDDDDKDEYDWIRSLAIMRKYGMNRVLVNEMIHTVEGDPSKLVISFDKPTAAGQYAGIIESQYDYIMKEKIDGRTYDEPDVYGSITELEKHLIELNDAEDPVEEQLFALKDLPFEWLKKYLGIILERLSSDFDIQVSIKNMAYMEALDALLKMYHNKRICQFLEVNFLQHLLKYVENSSFSNPSQCMMITRRLLPSAMHWVYEHHHPEIANEMEKINQTFDNIIIHINETLHLSNSNNIPTASLANLGNFNVKIGNLPRSNTVQALDAFYANLKFNSSDIHDNTMKLLKFIFDVDYEKISQALDNNIGDYFDVLESKFEFSNALQPYYVSEANVLIIPAELLRMPFYNANYSDVFKYSLLGNIMAYNVYKNLDLLDFAQGEVNKIAAAASLQSTLEAFLSSSPTDILKESFTIPKYGIEMSVQKAFFLSAAQLTCSYNKKDKEEPVMNEVFLHVPKFVKYFQCKPRQALEIFLN